MLKINDIAVIYRSYVHEDDIPFSSYRDGDVCVILDVFEGGTESWSGRDVGESYKVLNERSGETINLPHTVWLLPYSDLYSEPYVRKTEAELKEARKQSIMEWIEAEKQAMYEANLYKSGIISTYISEIKELESGLAEYKYTERYFKNKMKRLINQLNKYEDDMNEVQLGYKNELMKKYSNL